MAADEDESKNAEGSAAEAAAAAQERRAREKRQRPPVTIDLTADEVRGGSSAEAKPEPAKEAAPAEPPKPAPERPASTTPRPGSGFAGGAEALRGAAARALAADDGRQRALLAGVAGGVIALVLVLVLQGIGLLPSPGRSTANAAIEQARAASDAAAQLERRVAAMEAMTESLPALRTDATSLAGRIAALEAAGGTLATDADVKGVTDTLAALRERVDALPPPGVTREDLAALTERIGRLEVTAAAGGSGTDAASTAAIASLSDQLAKAESGLRSLTDRLAAAEAKVATQGGMEVGGEGVLRGLAIASLRRASESDLPFADDVDMVAALGIAGDELQALRPFANAGVPSKAALAEAFPPVADAILAASSAADPDASFFQRALNGLGSLVSIRPAGPVPGTDPPAIVSRMTAALAAGDVAVALAEREALPSAAREASAAWAAKAADRVALDQIVERIARSLDAAKS